MRAFQRSIYANADFPDWKTEVSNFPRGGSSRQKFQVESSRVYSKSSISSRVELQASSFESTFESGENHKFLLSNFSSTTLPTQTSCPEAVRQTFWTDLWEANYENSIWHVWQG